MPTKHEYTSTLRTVKYESTLLAPEVIARLDAAVKRAVAGEPMADLRKLRNQSELAKYVGDETGDGWIFFNDFPFHKLVKIADANENAGLEQDNDRNKPIIVTYTIGNPVLAQKIIPHNPWAAVCIPPRLLVVEHPDRSGTSVFYQVPSTVMGATALEGENSEELQKTLEALDRKIEALVMKITAE
ncbi:hypothetical protein D9619_000326 [Psilocybe cf. subviscida]|uniref:DUF302 domain-containing protein n=1 Tax=Psilocybe cf. subviscida TaxID=2480587 RepID=A0A8H5BD17_9AGAR|nr:hypothetical protein D9619_000326 [Psilocybe cf. subviscida]